MRLRYYLRGLGLGILFAVIIIAICGKGTEGSLSDSQIMQRASELGMVSTENVKNHTLSNDTEAVKKHKMLQIPVLLYSLRQIAHRQKHNMSR